MTVFTEDKHVLEINFSSELLNSIILGELVVRLEDLLAGEGTRELAIPSQPQGSKL